MTPESRIDRLEQALGGLPAPDMPREDFGRRMRQSSPETVAFLERYPEILEKVIDAAYGAGADPVPAVLTVLQGPPDIREEMRAYMMKGISTKGI